MMPYCRILTCWLVLVGAPLVSKGQSSAPPPYKPAANADEAVKRIEQLGGSVRKAATGSDALEVDLRNTAVSDEHLQYLLVLKNISVVRLRECALSDAGLVVHLGKITSLQKLHLEKTNVSELRALVSADGPGRRNPADASAEVVHLALDAWRPEPGTYV